MIIVKNFDYDEYYTTRDPDLLASNFVSNLAFLSNSWSQLGRPTVSLLATQSLLGNLFSFNRYREKIETSLKPRASSIVDLCCSGRTICPDLKIISMSRGAVFKSAIHLLR